MSKERIYSTPRWDLACKVYVGNLVADASKFDIQEAFKKFGPLKGIWVARNPPGFAFVEFECSLDAKEAVRAMHGAWFCGTKIRVQMSSGKRRAGRNKFRKFSAEVADSKAGAEGYRSRTPSRSPRCSSREWRTRSRSGSVDSES